MKIGKILKRISKLAIIIEDFFIVVLLGSVIGLSVMQVLMRLFLSSSFIWADELIKILVLWTALVASVSASRNNQHLKIDIIRKILPSKLSLAPQIVAEFFAFIVCILIAWHSYRFINLTSDFNETVLINFPAWIVYIIVPIAFFLMAYRYMVLFVSHTVKFFRQR